MIVLDQHIEEVLDGVKDNCEDWFGCREDRWGGICASCRIALVINKLKRDVQLLDQKIEAAALVEGIDREDYEEFLEEWIFENQARLQAAAEDHG